MSRRVPSQVASRLGEATAAFFRLARPSPPVVVTEPRDPGRGYALESLAEGGDDVRQMPIEPLPFRIGRRPGLELVLPSHCVSRVHAEISEQDGVLFIRDLESRNGTFVNHVPISEAEIGEGDIVHVGDYEFRIGRPTAAASDGDGAATATYAPFALSDEFRARARAFRELITRGDVTAELQPIVYVPSGRHAFFEALGRGTHPDLPRSPIELFQIAESLGAEIPLSRLFRRKAVELFAARSHANGLFLNTHPAELREPGLVDSVEELRRLAPDVDLTLEIHESALAQPEAMATLRDHLSEINVGLAYDDFGVGQARLLELAEAPPHYLKFDRRFVMGIDQAPASRQRLVASLVAAARELLVKTVAEGVETAAEAEVCARLGFTLAQGYHFGRPGPVESF